MNLDPQIILAVGKREEECAAEDRKLRALEHYKCKKSFVYFLGNYCKIIEPPTQDNPGGIIRFELWPHIIEAIKALLTQKLIDWLKSRQVGASWLIAAYVLWFALFHLGATIGLFSRGETEAFELLAKCKRIYSQLPDFLKLKIQPDSSGELGFPAMMSSIKAFAATEAAGVSFTFSIIVCDEWLQHPYAEQNYFASKPARDAGGQFIGIFTSDPEKLDGLAIAIFKDAVEGKSGYTPLFTPYFARPGRDSKWYDETKKSIPLRDLGTLTPELYMLKNYPASIEEALSPAQTIAAFDLKVVTEMMADVRQPIKVTRDGIDSNIIHIYKDFSIGQYFIAATDTSHGVGRDFSVTTIMNIKTGEVIADIVDNTLPPEELALHSTRMLDIFQNPLWFIESNDYGGVTILTAQNLNYRNLGYEDDKNKKVGFNTQGSLETGGKVVGTRVALWGSLIPAINNRQIQIYNVEGLKQFSDIIRNAQKQGRIEAMHGRHDDYPMAVGICWLKKDEVSGIGGSLAPIETLHFKNRTKLRRRW
jgi:hypothetical protein